MLYAQKKAWKLYATKRKLRYEGNGLYESPTISGALSGHRILGFTSDHSEYDARSQRRLTSFEVTLNSALPLGTAIASGGMVPYIQTVQLQHEYRPEAKGWDDSYIIRTGDKSIVAVYLNEKRLKALLDLMKMPKAWIVLIFYDGGGLLRLDTPMPLSSPHKLDKIMKTLLAAADIFELETGEYTLIRKKSKEIGSSTPTLDIEDETLEDSLTLELEEDEVDELSKKIKEEMEAAGKGTDIDSDKNS